MCISIEECDDSGMSRVFEVMSEAFKHDQPFFDALYPNHDTPEGRIQCTKRLLEQKQKEPNPRFIKAVDTETNEIIGQATWLILDKLPLDEQQLEGDLWNTEDDKLYAQHLFKQFLTPRSRVVEDAERPVLGKSHNYPLMLWLVSFA